MDDELHARIAALVEEEHRLRATHDGVAEVPDADRSRMRQLEESLDQAWDLLRQRQARRAAGQDVDKARERPADVVEHYLG